MNNNLTQKHRTTSQFRSIAMTFLCVALVLLLHTHLPICNGLSIMDLNLLEHSETDVMTKSLGECFTESELDSETHRRVLEEVQHRYISYETLKRDMVPCDRAGASYYNCHPRQANPYNRGCEVITACARGIQGIKT